MLSQDAMAAQDSPITVVIKIKRKTSYSVGKETSVGEIRRQVAAKMKCDPTTIRLFLNGERLEDKEQLNDLDLKKEDFIEIFKECTGGGPPQRHKQRFSDEQIIEALNTNYDDNDSEASCSEKSDEHDSEVNQAKEGTSSQEINTKTVDEKKNQY